MTEQQKRSEPAPASHPDPPGRPSSGQIRLYRISFFERAYAPAGDIAYGPVTAPSGTCWFAAVERTRAPLTSITHQISSDGLTYQAVEPDSAVTVPSPFWYRVSLARNDSQFQYSSSANLPAGYDPPVSSGVQLTSSRTRDLGTGIFERTLVFSTVSGALTLPEEPVAGTLAVRISEAYSLERLSSALR